MPKWQRVLWQKQAFDDNHVAGRFLEELQKNANVKHPSFVFLSGCSVAVAQQMSVIAIFWGLFWCMLDSKIHQGCMAMIATALLFAQPMIVKVAVPRSPTLLSMLTSRGIFAAILRVFSPVLLSLTKSYSDDTLYALAGALSMIHLFLHDYAFINSPAQQGKASTSAGSQRWGTLNCISLNAALFTAVLLASRLNDHESVFELLLFAVELFAFFPISCYYAKQRSFALHLAVAGVLFVTVAALLAAINRMAGIIYVLLVMLVTLVCPLWMLGLYQFKDEIRGPWDVMHINKQQ